MHDLHLDSVAMGHFRMIRAIDIAVASMKIGEKILLRTTSRYGLGEKGECRMFASNNKNKVVKLVLKKCEGDMNGVPDASAMCDITYTAQSYPGYFKVYFSERHIKVMVDEYPTLPEGFHEALNSMDKHEVAKCKVFPALIFGAHADEKMDGNEKRQAQDEIALVHNNLTRMHQKRRDFNDNITSVCVSLYIYGRSRLVIIPIWDFSVASTLISQTQSPRTLRSHSS